jgi:hypothetical protein
LLRRPTNPEHPAARMALCVCGGPLHSPVAVHPVVKARVCRLRAPTCSCQSDTYSDWFDVRLLACLAFI